MAIGSTHTFATLDVPVDVWELIAGKLREAGYDHVFCDHAIDMHGIGLTKDETVTNHNLVVSLGAEVHQLRRRRDDLLRANNEFETRARRAEGALAGAGVAFLMSVADRLASSVACHSVAAEANLVAAIANICAEQAPPGHAP